MKLTSFIRLLTINAILLSGMVAQTIAPLSHYKSAGIVPFALDTSHNVWILIGTEPGRKNQGFDFGGSKSRSDKNNPIYTAAREGTEELLFIFDDEIPFENLLQEKAHQGSSFLVHTTKAKTYWDIIKIIEQNPIGSLSDGYQTYFVKITFDTNLPTLFSMRRQRYLPNLPYSWKEKAQIYWVKLSDVITALHSNQLDSIDITVQPGTNKIRLYYPFARSLKMAFDNGIFSALS